IGPEGVWRDVAYRNLADVWRNYAAAGAGRLLIAAAVEDRNELERIRGAVPGARIVVCRLTASLDTMRERVARREPGLLREQYVARVAALDAVLDEARVEDFVLVNDDDRRVTEVATEMLARAGW